METHWLLGHAPERKRAALKETVQLPLLFNIRESENRRRSPKTEFLRRVNAGQQAHHSLDDSATLFNGAIPNKPGLLRLIQDSPLIRKRHSGVQVVPTRDTIPPQPWDGNELGGKAIADPVDTDSYGNFFFRNTENDVLMGEVGSLPTSGDHELKNIAGGISAIEEVTRPLLSAQRRLENLKKFRRKCQTWGRSLSDDVLDKTKDNKASFANFFRGTPRSPGAGNNNLQTLTEIDTEESIV